MIFSLHIISAPYSRQAALSAFNFSVAALKSGHQIKRVFFGGDGVHTSNSLTLPPQDEMNIAARWSKLAVDNKIDLVVCIAAALRRGMMDNTEAVRYGKPDKTVYPPFVLSGLGQLVEAAVESDRLITFG